MYKSRDIIVHTECFPERIVRFNDKKHKKTPWITTGILNSKNRRNKLYRVLKQTKTVAISYATKKNFLTDIEMFYAKQLPLQNENTMPAKHEKDMGNSV